MHEIVLLLLSKQNKNLKLLHKTLRLFKKVRIRNNKRKKEEKRGASDSSVTTASVVSANVAVWYDDALAIGVVRSGTLVLACASRINPKTPAKKLTKTLQQQQQYQQLILQHYNHHSIAFLTQSQQKLVMETHHSAQQQLSHQQQQPLVKAEHLESAAGASSGSSSSGCPRPPGNGSGLFAGIASSNKRPRTDDWLAPESPQGPLPQQHIYMSPQQQQQQHMTMHHPHQQQQPPMAHSTPITQQNQQPPSNGYGSPMSSGSYDPYSPNGKIGKSLLFVIVFTDSLLCC